MEKWEDNVLDIKQKEQMNIFLFQSSVDIYFTFIPESGHFSFKIA